MNKKSYYPLNLSLFAGEGAPAGDAGAAEGTKESGAIKYTPVNTRRGKSGDLSNVLYGSEAETQTEGNAAAAAQQEPEVQTTSNTLEERRKAFRDMVTGEYKDVYTEETQRIIDRRFAETRSLQKQLDDAKPVLDKLAARYNILDGDMAKLEKALEEDGAYWQAAAEEVGMPVDQFRQYQQMRQQNAELLRFQQQRMAQEQANAQAQRWFIEGEALRQKFPQFDLREELQNPEFVRLLRAGTPVEHAYKVMHFDALMGDAVQLTAANTEEAVVNNIRAKGTRPVENGTASQSTFVYKNDVSKLNKADRKEIARRVLERGETISF